MIDIIEAIVENRNQTFVVNAPNDGAIPNLPADAIVEVNAAVNGYGIRPISAGPLPEPLAAHLRGYVDFQQHVVKAALSGDRTPRCTPSCSTPTCRPASSSSRSASSSTRCCARTSEWLPLFRAARA